MRADDFESLLRRTPFEPFRVTLTDGRTYDVHHPELAMVGRSSVIIGLPRVSGSERRYDRFVTVSLVHVMQLEAIETATGATAT